MKYILLFLVTTHVYASLQFSQERSTSFGVDRMEFLDQGDEVIIKKSSNWFDTNNDYRLGEFTSHEAKKIKLIKDELKKIESELNAAEERLVAQGSSFNQLNNNKSPHSPYFKLNNFKIQESSILYPRLVNLSKQLQELKLELVSGVELDKSRKNYVFYKDGKEVSREPFNARFFCQVPRFPTRCMARQWGALYLE